MERIPVSVLLASDGKTCAQITHILKILGNGSMQEGLKNFYAYAEGRGLLQGRLQGAAGMLCASITLYFILNSWKMKQSLDNKEHSLQTAIKESSQVDETNVDAQDFSKQ